MGGDFLRNQQLVSMSGRSVGDDARTRRWPLVVLPVVCAGVALAALLWVRSSESASAEGTGDESPLTAEGERLFRAMSSGDAIATETERFLSDADAAADALLAGGEGDGTAVLAWNEPADVPELSGDILRAYQSAGEARLVTSGYLDLKGNVWGAVLEDARGWVDIVSVSTTNGDESEARVVRTVVEESGG